jgi:hypothetical protein
VAAETPGGIKAHIELFASEISNEPAKVLIAWRRAHRVGQAHGQEGHGDN